MRRVAVAALEQERLTMSGRLVALDEGQDIPLDHAMIVVGRHPQCDARLDSLRVSRHHCCMTPDHGELIVRDLGSTNGIRINGQRVETGRLKPGDELSIAHIRYRLDGGQGHDRTIADLPRERESARSEKGDAPRVLARPAVVGAINGSRDSHEVRPSDEVIPPSDSNAEFPNPSSEAEGGNENPLAAAVRKMLPTGVADRCQIQVIVQMPGENGTPPVGSSGVEDSGACRRDLSP
jgi:hypothetical protein